MTDVLLLANTQLQAIETAAPAGGTARVVVRVLLGVLIVVLASYIALEQIGSWRRRRSGRE